MKKILFSTGSSPVFNSAGLLLLRLMFGLGMLLGHGWGKLADFRNELDKFQDPLGIGRTASLSGAVFAEVVCAALLTLGLFTRLSLIPLIFTMAVAAFVVHGNDSFSGQEKALLYLLAYIALFFTGPGKYSIDQKLR